MPETKRISVPIQSTPVANGLPSPSASLSDLNNVQSKYPNIAICTSGHGACTTSYTNAATTTGIDNFSFTIKGTHLTEWSLDEVVEWLTSKGFNQDICNKFIGNFFLFLTTYMEPYVFLQNKKSQAMCPLNLMSISSNPKSTSWQSAMCAHRQQQRRPPTIEPTAGSKYQSPQEKFISPRFPGSRQGKGKSGIFPRLLPRNSFYPVAGDIFLLPLMPGFAQDFFPIV